MKKVIPMKKTRYKLIKNNEWSSEKSLQIDLIYKGKRVDFCVLKKTTLTKRLKKVYEEKLNIHISDDEIIPQNVYVKNNKFKNVVDGHFK